MIRKLALAMVVTGALGSNYANALGLGEIKLNSALNQPLDAEVKLLNVGDLSKNEILPNLASHSDFERAGVERVFFLTGIKFDVELDGKGGAVIHLTSDRIVREPFLNFLIEVHWPSGRLLREYTALLDPPLFSEASLAPVQQAATAPVQAQPVSKTTSSYNTLTRDAAPAKVALQSTTPSPSGKRDGTVRVKKNDTLWGIANENRPDRSVTVRQTMLAIQQENPHAFIDNNINLLKSGQVLRIPEVDAIRRISANQAYSEIARQNDAWAGKKTIDATQSYGQADSVSTAPAEQTGLIKLLASDAESIEEAQNQRASGGVQGATDSAEKAGSEDVEVAGGASSVANVSDLEKELEDLQRLVTLKQEQLAILQATLAEQESQAAAEIPVDESAASAVESKAEAVVGKVDAAVVEVEDNEAVAVAGTPDAAATVAEATREEGAAVDAANQEGEDAAARIEAAKAQEKRPEQGVLDILTDNPLYIGVLLVVLLGALILLGAISRRRKEEEYSPEPAGAATDSFNEEVDFPDDLENALNNASAGSDTEEFIEEEDLEVSADAAEKPVENDVRKLLEEADIYIAYGRYERAAEILQPAVNDNSQNTALRLKLAEIFLANNERARFEQQEMDLQAIGDAGALTRLEELKAKYGELTDETGVLLNDEEVVDKLSMEAGKSPAELEEFSDLEFELPQDEEVEASAELVSHDNLVDFDMEAEDFLDVEADISEPAEKDNVVEFSLDKEASTDTDEEVSDVEDMDFLVDTDESATKLELAKAYIDMADTDAAQDILNEVISEGSDTQKEEARKLLANLE